VKAASVTHSHYYSHIWLIVSSTVMSTAFPHAGGTFDPETLKPRLCSNNSAPGWVWQRCCSWL